VLTIDHIGLQATLQDIGRYGHRHSGFTSGGAMDQMALLWSHYLLDNHSQCNSIEIAMGQLAVTFQSETNIAITGAKLKANLNNKTIPMWCRLAVNCGDQLQLEATDYGMWSYLSVAGGFTVVEHFDSCSTVMREGVGGLLQNGRALQKGDQLQYQTHTKQAKRRLASINIPNDTTTKIIEFINNEHWQQFDCLTQFTKNSYTVSDAINRMGYRLQGMPLPIKPQTQLSEGVVAGAIQITGDGQPIVLMRDCQTIAGYPIIGWVTQLNLSKLAQCRPTTKIQFKAVKRNKAANEWQQWLRFIQHS